MFHCQSGDGIEIGGYYEISSEGFPHGALSLSLDMSLLKQRVIILDACKD